MVYFKSAPMTLYSYFQFHPKICEKVEVETLCLIQEHRRSTVGEKQRLVQDRKGLFHVSATGQNMVINEEFLVFFFDHRKVKK